MKVNDCVSTEKLQIPHFCFLLGLFVKQFYLLPSGSFQIGDLLIMVGCFTYLVFVNKGKFYVTQNNFSIIVYFFFIFIINFAYYVALNYQGFIKPIIYYFYNLVVILSFSSFLLQENSIALLKGLGSVLKLSLIIQLVLFVAGIGRWAYASRYSGSFNDPNQYSVFVFFSFLMIFLIDHAINKKYWMIWCLLGSFLVLPSTSTGTMLGVILFWGGLYLYSLKILNNLEKFVWGILLIGMIVVFLMISTDFLPLPDFILSNKMYNRFLGKIGKFSKSSDISALFSDRGWTRVLQFPEYFLYGAGEGGYNRFDTWLEIHSSIIGPLFYYGVVPFTFFLLWIYDNLKKTKYLFIYISLFAEALFLVNTRQPLYWMLIILGHYPLLSRID